MSNQLQLDFPKYHFNMVEAKTMMLISDMMKKEKEIERLKNSNRVHKGHYTKLKNKK